MNELTAEKIARDAIGLFLEYRDKHGKTEEQAEACAIQEVLEAQQFVQDCIGRSGPYMNPID